MNCIYGDDDIEKHWPMDRQRHVRKMQGPRQRQPQQRLVLASQLPPTNAVTLANLLLQATDTSITTASTPSTTTGNYTDHTPWDVIYNSIGQPQPLERHRQQLQATTPTTVHGKPSTTTALKWDVGYMFDLTM